MSVKSETVIQHRKTPATISKVPAIDCHNPNENENPSSQLPGREHQSKKAGTVPITLNGNRKKALMSEDEAFIEV